MSRKLIDKYKRYFLSQPRPITKHVSEELYKTVWEIRQRAALSSINAGMMGRRGMSEFRVYDQVRECALILLFISSLACTGTGIEEIWHLSSRAWLNNVSFLWHCC